MRDSEAQFRELADTTPALMWMTDAEGDVTFVNQGWLPLHRRDRDRRRDLRGERPPGRSRGDGPALERGHEPPRGVPLRVPAPARGLGRLPLGARARHAALLRRRVRGLRGHRHGHPRAAHDGGGAARVRGELPRARRHGPGDDVDHRHGRPDHVREPGLAALHGHDVPGGDGRELGARRASRRRRADARELGGGARRAAPVGGRVPAEAPHRRVPLDPRPRRAAVRGRATSSATWARRSTSTSGRRWRRACSRSTSASTGSPRRSSAACSPSGCRRSRASRSPPATCPARAAPPSAATGTTCSSAPTGAWRSWWATWPATACARPPRWASSATRSAPTGWSRPRPRRWWRASTGW